ncbi:MAG: Ig-like domain-containing protein, partial [Bacteroidales bacterium]|nr:Ig-like domain-containing protein [Bacteroidales bacterium]
MKRLAVLIVMAAALAASCVKEPVDNNFTDTDKVDEGNGTYIYTVKASAAPETRSNYDDDGVFSWSDGDAISVLFHNGTQNKFFTLTIDSADAGKKTASFSGAIDDGYEIGASDGTTSDMKIWALFPASDSHTYTIGENPKFYIPEETDYTTTHFSANLPMVSHLTEEGSISFRNYVCAYKFTVTNIDATKAPKIKAVVTNGVNYALSGLVAMGSDYLKMNNEDVDNGASKTVSYICDVAYDNDPTKGTAVFYVASRWSSASFQPTIQIINYSTGLTIKEFVADKASSLSRGQVKPIKLNVSGGDYFIPAIKIDGSFGDWDDVSHVFAANNSGLVEWKYTTDTRNLYFLYKVTTTQIVADGSTFDNSPYFYIGFDTDCKSTSGSSAGGGIGAGMEAEALIRPWKGASNATPQCEIGVDENGHLKRPISTTLADKPEVGGKIIGDYCYVEVCIPRSALGSPTGPINVKHSFRWSVTDGALIMPETTTITAEDQTVDEEQTVSIGATTNSTATITYTSNNTAVATVDANGVITGVAEGSTTITLNAAAVAGEYTAASTTINVTVTKPYVPAIVIDGD